MLGIQKYQQNPGKMSGQFILLLAIVCGIPFSNLSKAETSPENSQEDNFKPIKAYSAEYILKSQQYKMSAKAKRSLSFDENNIATLELKASLFIAKVNQSSKFLLSDNACTLGNINYRYDRTIFGKHKSYKIDFDFGNKKLIENNDGKKQTLPLDNSFYDELSYQELLRCELMNKSDLKIGDMFEYSVRTKGKNKQYIFKITDEETLDTRIGKLATIKLTRIRDKQEESEENFIWFAKEHNYLLVKIFQKDEDDTLHLDISELSVN